MKRWQGSCLGAFLVLLICGGSLIFLVPLGGAMIAGMPPVFDKLTAYVLCPDATDYSHNDLWKRANRSHESQRRDGSLHRIDLHV
jgi:hypothetical protein